MGRGAAWAFSLGNASANYVEFRRDLEALDEVNWTAVSARDFREPAVKEGKQAEFLLHGFFPWPLVERIGVANRTTFQAVADALAGADHRPRVEVTPGWYY